MLSISQIMQREANIKDAVSDILRLLDVYKARPAGLIGGKLGHSDIMPLGPEEALKLVEYAVDSGKTKVGLLRLIGNDFLN